MESVTIVRVEQVVRVTIPESVYKEAKEWNTAHRMGHRSFGNGNKQQQLSGVLGEIAVFRYLTGRWPVIADRGNCFDNGIDIEHAGLKLDVKTKTRQGYVLPHFANTVYDFQINYDNDSYIFCSYNKFYKTVEICGWVTKDFLKENGTFVKAGTAEPLDDGGELIMRYNSYSLPNTALLDIALLKIDY